MEIYLKVLLIVSFVTLIFYGVDKARAADSKTRIPEITLLILAAIGGALGAFLGRILFNHKRNVTSKIHFSIVIYFSMILQVGFYVFLVLLRNGVITL